MTMLTDEEWAQLERSTVMPAWVVRDLREAERRRQRDHLAIRHALAGYPLGRTVALTGPEQQS